MCHTCTGMLGSAVSEQRTRPIKFLHVCTVIGFIMGVPHQTVKANTTLTVIRTQTVIMKKKKKDNNIIPIGICRCFSSFQKLITHLQGQKCSQLSRHEPIKSISCTSQLGSTIILLTGVDPQNKTLEKDTR